MQPAPEHTDTMLPSGAYSTACRNRFVRAVLPQGLSVDTTTLAGPACAWNATNSVTLGDVMTPDAVATVAVRLLTATGMPAAVDTSVPSSCGMYGRKLLITAKSSWGLFAEGYSPCVLHRGQWQYSNVQVRV